MSSALVMASSSGRSQLKNGRCALRVRLKVLIVHTVAELKAKAFHRTQSSIHTETEITELTAETISGHVRARGEADTERTLTVKLATWKRHALLLVHSPTHPLVTIGGWTVDEDPMVPTHMPVVVIVRPPLVPPMRTRMRSMCMSPRSASGLRTVT